MSCKACSFTVVVVFWGVILTAANSAQGQIAIDGIEEAARQISEMEYNERAGKRYLLLGVAYLKQEDFKKAEHAFLKSVFFEEFAGQSNYNLGFTYWKMGFPYHSVDRYIRGFLSEKAFCVVSTLDFQAVENYIGPWWANILRELLKFPRTEVCAKGKPRGLREVYPRGEPTRR